MSVRYVHNRQEVSTGRRSTVTLNTSRAMPVPLALVPGSSQVTGRRTRAPSIGTNGR